MLIKRLPTFKRSKTSLILFLSLTQLLLPIDAEATTGIAVEGFFIVLVVFILPIPLIILPLFTFWLGRKTGPQLSILTSKILFVAGIGITVLGTIMLVFNSLFILAIFWVSVSLLMASTVVLLIQLSRLILPFFRGLSFKLKYLLLIPVAVVAGFVLIVMIPNFSISGVNVFRTRALSFLVALPVYFLIGQCLDKGKRYSFFFAIFVTVLWWCIFMAWSYIDICNPGGREGPCIRLSEAFVF